jgi:hypothetical protein
LGELRRVAKREIRIALALVGLGLVLLFAFTGVYLAAFNDPQPHGVRVAIVGDRAVMRIARATLDPDRFHVVAYPSERAALDALEEDRARGVLALRDGAASVEVATAYGGVPAQVTGAALAGVASAAGAPSRMRDVRPLPEHDSRGLSSFFLVLATGIASLLFAVLLTIAGRRLALGARLGACALVAAAGGLVVAFVVETVVGALDGSFLGVAGIAALLVAAIVLTVHGLGRLAGPVGLAVGGAVFLLVGTSSAGGGVTYQLQPGFYRALSQLLPNGAAVTAIRNEVYFSGAHTLGAIAILGAWSIAGALLVLIERSTR